MNWIGPSSRWVIGHRGRVLAGWVVLLVAALAVSRAVGSHYTNDNSLPGTQSQRASDLLQRSFRTQSGDSDQIVLRAAAGTLADPALRRRIVGMLADVRGLPHVSGVVSPYSHDGTTRISADGTIGFATVLFDRHAADLPNSAIKHVIATAEDAHTRGLRVELGGAAIEQAERPALGPATLVGLAAAIVVLLITFGSAFAMGLPIVTALLGLGTAFGVIGLVSRLVNMPSVSTQLAAMIGLGVGIDYALFIVTRFREEFRGGTDLQGAIAAAMDSAGRAVVFAGLTVIVALLGMLALGVSFLSGMAVSSAIAVFLTVASAITVLPALLARFGERIGRPRRRGQAQSAPLWRRWALFVNRHPWQATLSGLAVMLLLASPAFSLRLGVTDAGNDRSSQTTRRAYDLLTTGFGAGYNGPLQIVAQLPRRNDPAALATISATLKRTAGVASVSRPRVSPRGLTAVWQVFPDSSPQATATSQLVRRLRADVLPTLDTSTRTTILVGGVTAVGIDFTHVLAGKLALFVAIVLLLAALLLFVVFGSLLIPLQAVVMNLLSIAAAIGVTVAIFQYGWLGNLLGLTPGPIDPWLPVMVFAIVFGLSMDYEVFLISRIHENWSRDRDASTAVIDGLGSTGRVITAAATIMICVFLSFAAGPERAVKLFGISLAAGVFIDAFVIRSLVLPGTLQLLGHRTWQLPGRLANRLPRLVIEPEPTQGASEHHSHAQTAPAESVLNELTP
jgi:putative drug exporter of the RND superfamily